MFMLRHYKNSYGIEIMMTDCGCYVEDPYICDDLGEPKGQCQMCGSKWYEHTLDVLPLKEQESAKQIQENET